MRAGQRIGVILLAGIGLAACSNGGSSSNSPSSTNAAAPSTTSSAPPTVAEVKTALESTGITLCSNLSQAGNLTEYIFPQSTSGDCANGQGLIYIFSENSTAAAQSDAQNVPAGASAWIDQTIAVWDTDPAPGTGSALAQIGFKTAS